MADEHIPMEFYTDDTLAVDLGEVYMVEGSGGGTGGTEISTMFFTEYQLPLGTPTDVTELVTYKPSFSEAQDHFGYTSSADNVPLMRVVWKQGVASSTTEEILPLIKCIAPWADAGSFTLYFGNKDYALSLVYQYDTSVSPYGDLLSVTALLTEEDSIGDIETALDGIISIQEALIGGDSV